MYILSKIGKNTLYRVRKTGIISIFLYETVKNTFKKWYVGEFVKNVFYIGYLSLPVVSLTAVFTGCVIALQTYVGADRYNVVNVVPNLVVLTITRELGAVLTALIVTGKISSSIATEIGTMRITEQIDALETLSVNPIKYLVVPRVCATLVSLPLLVVVADILGIFGGFLVGVYNLNFNPSIYIIKTIDFVTYNDIMCGILKSVVFGLIISFTGCYCGYNSKGGAKGVGRAVTLAVISSCILILLLDLVLTKLLFI
ncbi:MAG: ABC transporter permease [Rickettsiales bacterium]|jgi:phospholipid/cholesterol/gamma-HCH transport system permease protein|nr:ABC transporter permease [Rickettsiales bacterium]